MYLGYKLFWVQLGHLSLSTLEQRFCLSGKQIAQRQCVSWTQKFLILHHRASRNVW